MAGALLDVYEEHQDKEALELALGCRCFLVSLLDRQGRPGPYFSYVASGSSLIHNANLLVCGTLARLDRVLPDEEAAAAAVDATETTIRAQDPRGLWPYGAGVNLTWADNFHTAYVLENLIEVQRSFDVGEDALRAGLRAWRQAFFNSNGGARLYPDERFPLEAHSFASAIDLCCAAADADPGYSDFAELIARRAVELLWLPREGRFGYRVTRLGTNRREFMRWTNAPMLRALARLLSLG